MRKASLSWDEMRRARQREVGLGVLGRGGCCSEEGGRGGGRR